MDLLGRITALIVIILASYLSVDTYCDVKRINTNGLTWVKKYNALICLLWVVVYMYLFLDPQYTLWMKQFPISWFSPIIHRPLVLLTLSGMAARRILLNKYRKG